MDLWTEQPSLAKHVIIPGLAGASIRNGHVHWCYSWPAAKYQSELSHNVSNVRGGRADCLDFQSIAYAGHGLSVLLQAEVDGLPPRL